MIFLRAVGSDAGQLLGAEHDVLQHGEVVGQHEVLVHHADAGPDRLMRRVDADRLPVNEDLALVWPLHPVQDLHQGRLAGAVLPDDGVDRAAPHGQEDVVVGDHAREPLGDAPKLNRRVGGRCGLSLASHGFQRIGPFAVANPTFQPEAGYTDGGRPGPLSLIALAIKDSLGLRVPRRHDPNLRSCAGAVRS